MATLPGYTALPTDITQFTGDGPDRIPVPKNYRGLVHPYDPGFIEAQAHDPWNQMEKYALRWVYLSLATLALFTLARIHHKFTDKRRLATLSSLAIFQNSEKQYAKYTGGDSAVEFFPPPQQVQHQVVRGSSLTGKITGMIRFLSYRRLSLRLFGRHTRLPTLGVMILWMFALAFCCGQTFIPYPMYRKLSIYGAAPIAARSGMIAVAMTPFIIALGMKGNLISIFTGIGHEKLNTMHRWLSWIQLLMSCVHTVPFLVQPYWDGGAPYMKEWFRNGGIIYINGIAALGCLAWLCFMSVPWVRRLSYELFAYTHAVMGVIYLAMLFWHTKNYLNSWRYLWSTMAIWIACLFIRFIFKNNRLSIRNSWFGRDRASIELLGDDAVRICIPTNIVWKPGQHVFLRLPELSLLDNHPFTITSIRADDEKYRNEDNPESFQIGGIESNLQLAFKPYGGFTKRVYDVARSNPDMSYRAILDGPYGGTDRRLEAFDTVILIAGGSGITPIMSHLLNLAQRMANGTAVVKDVRVIWAVRHVDSLNWFKDDLMTIAQFVPPGSFGCELFITARIPMVVLRNAVDVKMPEQPGKLHRRSNRSSWRNSWQRKNDSGNPYGHSKQDSVTPLAPAHFQYTSQPSLAPEPEPMYHLQQLSPSQIGVAHDGTSQVQLSSSESLDNEEQLRKNHAKVRMEEDEYYESDGSESPYPFDDKGKRVASNSLEITRVNNPNELPHTKDIVDLSPSVEVTTGFDDLPVNQSGAGGTTMDLGDSVYMHYGRPGLPSILKAWGQGFGHRTAVFCCGPESMKIDVANCIAGMQSQVVFGKGKEEIYLHTETFGY